MASESHDCGTFADDNTVGTVGWTSPGNAISSDDVRSTLTLSASAVSHYLKANNCGFSTITATDNVTSVVATVEAQKASGGGTLKDNSIQLYFAGAYNGINLADTVAWSLASDSTKTYTWDSGTGGLPTAAQVLGSDFGVGVSLKETSGFAAVDGAIDYIGNITVNYTTGIQDGVITIIANESNGMVHAPMIRPRTSIEAYFQRLIHAIQKRLRAVPEAQGKLACPRWIRDLSGLRWSDWPLSRNERAWLQGALDASLPRGRALSDALRFGALRRLLCQGF